MNENLNIVNTYKRRDSMNINKKKGFTLIELIAVLVIMAIIALIVTSLVMNIIRKARVAADKRSIDAYGRSIELAVAGYLLDHGYFPTSVDQLTIEYSGSQVECSTTQLNPDSSVYLTGCTVAGRTVDYAYGTDKNPQEPAAPTYTAYSIGDEVSYNNVDYYVIENSDTTQSTVKLLKAEPLNEEEINTYKPAEAQSATYYGYTWMQYGSNSNAYNGSYIKTTVDAWKTAKAPGASEARLITTEDLINLGYTKNSETSYSKGDNVPTWIYNSNIQYWTMSSYDNSTSDVWVVNFDGSLNPTSAIKYQGNVVRKNVRPVIILPKSLISNE